MSFFYDILVYSRSISDNIKHLIILRVFTILRKHQLYAKLSDVPGICEVEYLGHVILQEGVSVDPRKIPCILEWPRPTTPKALRGFLGLTGYYRKFVKNSGKIASPLTVLLKKDGFRWGEFASGVKGRLNHLCWLYQTSPNPSL